MRKMVDSHLRNAIAVIAMAAGCMEVGCSSEAKPADLTPIGASTLISQRWSRDELNHLTVTFHSDTVIGCGVQNDLWHLVETVEGGFTRRTYQLTEKGSKALFAIDLKESGKLHEITLRGPYRFEVTGITPGSQPDIRQVEIRWELDWDKAPAELKACVPKFELSGSQVALFKLFGQEWGFLSYIKPEDVIAPPQGTAPSKIP
jgi:hypothetical protein